jgi:predicted RNA-binding protein with PIN domain
MPEKICKSCPQLPPHQLVPQAAKPTFTQFDAQDRPIAPKATKRAAISRSITFSTSAADNLFEKYAERLEASVIFHATQVQSSEIFAVNQNQIVGTHSNEL